LRTAGRTAVISGVATATAGRVARRQQEKFARQSAAPMAPMPQQAAPAASAPGHDDLIGSLQMLTALHNSGDLNDQEFKAAKAKLLS
jgi:hypothetical protein